jgi:hypothetical protein
VRAAVTKAVQGNGASVPRRWQAMIIGHCGVVFGECLSPLGTVCGADLDPGVHEYGVAAKSDPKTTSMQ